MVEGNFEPQSLEGLHSRGETPDGHNALASALFEQGSVHKLEHTTPAISGINKRILGFARPDRPAIVHHKVDGYHALGADNAPVRHIDSDHVDRLAGRGVQELPFELPFAARGRVQRVIERVDAIDVLLRQEAHNDALVLSSHIPPSFLPARSMRYGSHGDKR